MIDINTDSRGHVTGFNSTTVRLPCSGPHTVPDEARRIAEELKESANRAEDAARKAA